MLLSYCRRILPNTTTTTLLSRTLTPHCRYAFTSANNTVTDINSTGDADQIDTNDTQHLPRNQRPRPEPRFPPSLTQRIYKLLRQPDTKYMTKDQLFQTLRAATDDPADQIRPRSHTHLGGVLYNLVRQGNLTVLPPTHRLLHNESEPYPDINKLTRQDQIKLQQQHSAVQSSQSFVYTMTDHAAIKTANIAENERKQQRARLEKEKRYAEHIKKYPRAAVRDQEKIEMVEKKASKWRSYADRHGLADNTLQHEHAQA